VREDAAALGCAAEVARAPEILARGTSAHRQRRVYELARAAGAGKREALNKVVDALIAETLAGV
jgi:carboxylate-amine ligase